LCTTSQQTAALKQDPATVLKSLPSFSKRLI
jgi:hypothetical protein